MVDNISSHNIKSHQKCKNKQEKLIEIVVMVDNISSHNIFKSHQKCKNKQEKLIEIVYHGL